MQKRFTPDEGGVFPEWEEKTIEEACNVNVSNGTPGDKFIYIELGDVNKYGLLKRKNLVQKHEAPVSAKRVAKVDDVFFRSVRPGNKGHFHYTNEMSEQVVMSSAFFQLSMKDGDNGFLYQALNSDYFCKQVLRKCAGTAYPTISLKEFIKLKIRIPKSIEEQRKIAAALAAYDEMIAVKTAKLETWQECKKRMVKEIFGRTKRFKDDDGKEFPEWEEKTLGEVAEINPASAESLPEVFYYMDLGSIDSGIWTEKRLINKKSAPSRAQRIAQQDDVFFQSVRPLNKDHYHYTKKADKSVVASTGFIQLRIKNGSNAFLYQLLYENNFNNEVRRYAAGSNYPAINATNLSKIKVMIPCMEEQQKIGSFLAELDKEIQIQKEFIKTYAEGKKRMMRELME